MFPTNSYRWRLGLSHSIRPDTRTRLSMSFMSAVTWRPCVFKKNPRASVPSFSRQEAASRRCAHLSDLQVGLAVQVGRFDVAHSLRFTVVEGEHLGAWTTLTATHSRLQQCLTLFVIWFNLILKKTLIYINVSLNIYIFLRFKYFTRALYQI